MSQISLKSISGITSITTPTGVDNQFTVHTNNTNEALKLDGAGNLHFHNHLNITGISTASNFKTGTSNLHNTGLNVQDLDVDGHTNLDNVSIAGVTTAGNLSGSNANFTGELTVAEMVGHTGDTHTKLSFPANDTIAFTTGGTERARIDSTGVILMGGTSSRDIGFPHKLQLEDIDTNPKGLSIVSNRNTVHASHIDFAKTRGTSLGSNTIVQNGDYLGHVNFRGADGTDISTKSSGISGAVDGTPGSDSVPGRLMFFTQPAGGTATERLRIGSAGQIGVAGANYGTSGQVLTSGGASGAVSWSTITGTTINNNADNRVITGSGTANTLNGESNLTYDGTNLQLQTDANNEGIKLNSTLSGGSSYPVFEMEANRSAGNTIGKLISKWNGTEVASIQFVSGSDGTNKDDAHIYFNTASAGTATERLRIASDGQATFDKGAPGSSNQVISRFQAESSRRLDIVWHDSGSLMGFDTPSSHSYIFKIGGSEKLRIDSNGRIGSQHNLSGTADYNRLMLYNPHSGSCWMQMMSTATGTGANTDGLSIGLNTSNIAHFWLRENAEMHFATNNSLRWRITSSGDIYPQGNYKIGLNSNTAFRMDEVNSNKFVHRYGNSGSATNNQQEAIWYGGGITVMHDNATLSTSSYTWGLTGHRGYALFRLKNAAGAAIYAESGSITSNSDYRMKENIVEITNGIETVKKLKPSEYNIRKTFNPLDDGKKHHGFVAHEVQEAIPDIGNIVSGTKDAMEEVFYGVDEDDVIPEGKKAGDSTGTFTDKPDYQGIDYGHITPVLAAAIKELITKVETLEAEVASLKSS